jgi:cytochrome c-type biogenesis protein CcmH
MTTMTTTTTARHLRRACLAALLGLAAAAAWAQAPSPAAPAPPASQPPVEEPSPDAAAAVGPPRGTPLSGAALEERTAEVSALLRCPVCQGLSVGDSPSSMAQKMRAQVRGLVAAGYERDQILDYFERSYGEFVRLRPALRGVNWLVWLAPAAGLLAGGVVVTWALRRGRGPGAPEEAAAEEDTPARDALPDDTELARYVLKVREEAYGWAGGLPPQEG